MSEETLMACPSCETLVRVDTEQEPEEEDDPEIGGGIFRATYRRVLTCEECGDELMEASIKVECSLDVPSECTIEYEEQCPYCNVAKGKQEECPSCGNDFSNDAEEHEWEFDLSVEPTMDVQTGTWNVAEGATTRVEPAHVRRKDVELTTTEIQRGDEVWEQGDGRDHRTHYGVQVSGTARCEHCGREIEIRTGHGIPAASFDEA